MEVLEAIKTRRNIRKYKSATVPEEDLKAIVEAVRNPGVAAISTAPLVLVLVAKKEHAGYYHGKAVTKHGDWFMFDLGLAI